VKEVKLTLARLSKGTAALTDAYDKAIQRIDGQMDGDKARAREVLSWITYAKRPLTTAELCCALAVEPEEAELDLENIPDVEDMLSVCAGLVVVDQESAVIRLVHYTTQEYFERIRDSQFPDAPLKVASACLTYLSFDVFKTGSCSSDEEFEERLKENKFLNYAAKHWGEHAAVVEKDVCALACSFLSNESLVSSTTQVLLAPTYKNRDYSKDYPRSSTGLHLAARLGLSVALEDMLPSQREETAILLGKKDSYGRTSLYLAAEYGHSGAVKLLLDKGADVNAHGGYYNNALQAASLRGHEAIVKLLLDKGANVNAQGGGYGNALQVASLEGHEAIVKLLLNKGADVNAQGGYYNNALQAALSKGHEAIVKLLLDKGADVNAQGEGYGNALQVASLRGHEAIVKLLLNKGANVNAQGGYLNNALQAASSGCHEAVVKLLLDKGADVNGNALQVASLRGHEAIVKLLLDKGADVNAQGRYGNALQAASSKGNEAIVKLLLDKSADPSAEGTDEL
jgi:ankyrin repeat protein